MKYFVIATKWDDKAKAQRKYIVGECSQFFNALLLRDAYNNHFHANAQIVTSDQLANQ